MEGPNTLDENVNLEAVKRCLNPALGPFRPPDFVSQPSIVQSITAYLSAPAVLPSPSGIVPQAKDQAIFWQPNKGCLALYRASKFTRDYSRDYTSSAGATVNPYTNSWNFLGAAWGPRNDIYVPVEDSRNISLSPDVAKTISRGRLVGGIVRVLSDATSTTSAAMSGTMNAGYVDDTRGLNGTVNPPELQQQTVTKKDSLMNHPVQKGVVLLLGSSIPKEYRPVSSRLAVGDDESGLETLYQAIDGIGIVATTVASQTYGRATAWVSSLYKCGGGTQAVQNQFFFSQIGLLDEPTVFVETQVSTTYTDGYVSFTHFWAYETYDTSTQKYEISLITSDGGEEVHTIAPGAMAAVNIGLFGISTSSRAMRPTVYGQGPPHANTVSNGVAPNIISQLNVHYAGTLIQLNCGIGGTMNLIGVRVVANELYKEGNLAAAVVQWTNMAAGQNMNLTAQLFIQGPAAASITPYVTSQVGNTSAIIPTDPKMLDVLSLLFADEHTYLFRRIWDMEKYDEQAIPQINALTMNTVLAAVNAIQDVNKRNIIYGYLGAGGWFGDMWKKIKTGVSDVGKVAANVGGKALNFVAKNPEVLGALVGAKGGYGYVDSRKKKHHEEEHHRGGKRIRSDGVMGASGDGMMGAQGMMGSGN